MKIELSIIIPAYNVEKYITRTLSSILMQNSSDIEIIVVNDGSTDQTGQVVHSIIESSSIRNIKLFTKYNGGVSSARNFGLDKSNGEYVYFLDGDDYVADGFVGSILELFRKHESQIVYWPYDQVDEAGNILVKFPYDAETIMYKTGVDTLSAILLERSTRIWTGSIAYNRRFLKENEIRYTPGCAVGEDLEFIFKALSYAQSILFTNHLKSFYLQRPASIMSIYSINKFDAVLALGRVRDHFLRFNALEFHLLAKHFNENEIIHYYAGTFRKCLQYLISIKKLSASVAIIQLSGEIERLYPGMKEDISLKMKSRKRRILPDKIDIFRFSPLLYMHFSSFNEKR